MMLNFQKSKDYFQARAYRLGFPVWDFSAGRLAAVLFVSDILFMTRFYALSNLVETVLFFLFMINPILRSQFIQALKDPVLIPLFLFFVWVLISSFWGYGSWDNRLDDWWSWRKILLLPIGLVLLGDPRVFRAALIMGALVGLLFLSLAVGSWLLGFEFVWERLSVAVLQNPNAQGIYFSILAALLVITDKKDVGRPFKSLHKYLFAFCLLVFTAALSSSRSGLLAVVIATIAITIFFIRDKKIWAFVWIGFIAVALATSPIAHDRIGKAISGLQMGLADGGGELNSSSIRMVMWRNTLKIIGDNWLIGTGAAGFGEAYKNEVAGQSGWRASESDNPHNQYLHIWAEYGLVGLILFCLFLVGLTLRCRISDPWGLCLATTLAIAGTVGLFDGIFGSAINGRICIFAFAICLTGISVSANPSSNGKISPSTRMA